MLVAVILNFSLSTFQLGGCTFWLVLVKIHSKDDSAIIMSLIQRFFASDDL